MKKLLDKYNNTKRQVDLINIEEYFRKKIDKFFNMDHDIDNLGRSKYHYQLFLMDDICFNNKFGFQIEISGLAKFGNGQYYLIKRKTLQGYDLKKLYMQVIDYFKESKYLFYNPYYAG